MSKKLMLSIIIVLIIMNIAILLFWNQDTKLFLEDGKQIKNEVATIDGKAITYEEWMDDLRKTSGKAHLKAMMDKEVVARLAKEKAISVNKKVIERDIALLTTMRGLMLEEERSEEEEIWRKDIVYRYQLEELLTEDVDVPEKDIKSFYKDYRKQYDFTASKQFSHITVKDSETADQIVRELDDGAAFSLLAKEFTTDLETVETGGYLGFFPETSQFLPDLYHEVASDMKEDSYSKPFKVDTGVAIIFLHRDLPEISFTYKEIKDYIKSELALNETEQSLTAAPLWDKLDIEWVYDE